MADSDDEYDRKRRDKFRGERSSGDSYRSERRDDRRPGGGGGSRDDWSDRGNPFRGGGGARARPDYRDYRGPRDRYGSPGREMPPTKRMRPDWGDDLRGAPRYGAYDPYLMHAWNEHYAAHGLHGAFGGHGHAVPHVREQTNSSDVQTQPAMLTLKQFLDTQDDGISDSEVLTKYSEYKLDFKRQQLNEFFVAHKDEEWFKNKYHPVESVKRKEEQLGFLQKRVDVFNELLESGSIKSVSIDTSQQDPLLRLLDTVVIKLEGGTDDDLKILDEKPRDIIYPDRIIERKPTRDDDVIITSVLKKKGIEDEPKVVSPQPLRRAVVASDDEENWDEDDDDAKSTAQKKNQDDSDDDDKKDKKPERKRKRSNSNSSSSSSSSSSSDSSSSSSSDDDDDDKVNDKYDIGKVKVEPEEAKKLIEEPEKSVVSPELEEDKKSDTPAVDENDEPKAINGVEEKDDESSNDTTATNEKKNDDEEELKKDDKEMVGDEPEPEKEAVCEADKDVEMPDADVSKDSDAVEPEKVETVESAEKPPAAEEKVSSEAKEGEAKDTAEDAQPETIDLEKEKDVPRPRALHRTSSIFLRNLAPSITKAEIEAICIRLDGFLRVAIADPLVERRWYRRGWVTFKRDVNIKEYCWNLNNTRLRDCEMGAIVNRDLSRRVRPVNGMTAHKNIVRSDIKLCARIAMNLDEKFKLWEKANEQAAKSNGNRSESSSASYGFKSNNPVLQNITDYLIEEASAEEDELLGLTGGDNKDSEGGESVEREPALISVLDTLILYLRIVHSVDFYNHCEYPYEDEMPNRCGIIHARGPAPLKVTQNDMNDYIKNFENKMQTFLAKTTRVEEDELKNLGCKDAEAEVEKFVQANTQELAKDKWLCPLSGKKFKGPEFIRKHIFNKHVEKVDEVRKEVEFFNNYLRDPKRPQLPEHPGSTKRTNSESAGGYRAPAYPPVYPPYAAYAPPMMIPGRGARGYGGRRELPMEHQRRIIGYHDLDAPANFDVFD